WLSGCLAIWLFSCLLACPSVYLPVWLPVCLFVCLSVWLFSCVAVCLPTRLLSTEMHGGTSGRKNEWSLSIYGRRCGGLYTPRCSPAACSAAALLPVPQI